MNDLQELEAKIKALLPEGASFEEAIAQTEDAWNNADVSTKERMDLAWRGAKARELSFKGWCHFYWCMTRREYPKAHYPIAKALLEAIKTGRAKMVQAWRGFGKSTDLVWFVTWLVGVRPSKSTAIIRINDTKAQLTGDLIAEVIENQIGWKACFPNVIPDKEVGWSSEKGYNVIDTNVTGIPNSPDFKEGYAKWRQICMTDHPTESSLMSAGIESGTVIGLHPTNGMYFDDLHDEKNTRSAVEMQKVVDIFENNIIPTWFTPTGKPIMACVCTPWDSDRDAYHSMLMTGLFDLVTIPIYTEDENGQVFPPLNKKVKLTWEEAYPMERVIEIFTANRERFYRMYLLDDKTAREISYQFRKFPFREINWKEWQITSGVDPNDTVVGISKGKGTSHYAISHVLESPYNTLIVGGGFVRKVPTNVGEKILADFARNNSRNFRAASIESNKSAAMIDGFITRNVGLIVHTHTAQEVGSGGKLTRNFKFLEPLFSNGILLLADGASNAEDEHYLKILESALTRYPNISPDEPEADVLDSLSMAVLDIPRAWTRVHTNIAIPQRISNHSRRENIANTLGSYSYLKG